MSGREPAAEADAGGWALDFGAFALGLALAWWLGWSTTDLVWSLWLSSLVVGYALIVWSIARATLHGLRSGESDGVRASVSGALFLLVFFTFHFGFFHFGHSVFLAHFFPLGSTEGADRFPGATLYAEVAQRYAIFLPAAFIAERRYFQRDPSAPKRAKAKASSAGLLAPYRNVVRMHLLIFFFAGAHWLGLEHFAVYAAVYAVYFLPWRRLLAASRRS